MLTNWLVKTFVRGYEDVEEESVRTSYGVLGSIVGMFCNLLLFGAKLAVGLFLGSVAVTADAFNNLSDAASSIISYVGVKLAERPADKEHPFGHGRYEYVAAFVVSFLILEVGLSFIKTSWHKIWHPQTLSFSYVSVVILVLSMGVKLWMCHFNKTLGERIRSTVMKATATDALGDVFATLATVISLILYRLININVDGYVGMVVACMVILAGIGVAKDTLEPLLGEAVDPHLAKMLQKEVESYEGILGSHDLIVHSYGPSKRMATIHAEVANDMDVDEAHELIDQIEYEVFKKTRVFLVIHTDPVEIKDQKVLKYKEMVSCLLKELDGRASFHDFRMTYGDHQKNLIFDLVLPVEYNEEEKTAIAKQLEEKIKAYDQSCTCVMTVEHSFVGEEDLQ